MSTENFKNKSFKADQLSKCPFTGAGTPAKFSAGRGQSVRDFWPNSLNLKILSQHSNLSNPMNKKFNYSKEFKKLNCFVNGWRGVTILQILQEKLY